MCRSYERITMDDLGLLSDLVMREREQFFQRNPRYKPIFYSSLIASVLCQGAAIHFVDGKNGVKDFDVYLFHRQSNTKEMRYPYRARVKHQPDSKLAKFGNCPCHPNYVGRHVDLMGKEISTDIVRGCKSDPACCIVRYLENPRTETAKHLSRKAVVGLYPEYIRGKIIWNHNASQNPS